MKILSTRSNIKALNIPLENKEYQDISSEQAAEMLGHFTHTLPDSGYPWELLEAKVTPQADAYRKGRPLSDMEALKALRKGRPVVFQPRRDLQLDLSADSLTALAATAPLFGGEATALNQAAQLSSTTRVSAGSQGVAVNFGEPVVIKDLAQLKLLRQLHDANEKIPGESSQARAAHHFSHFTQKSEHSTHWRFYSPESARAGQVVRQTLRGTGAGALVGSVLGGAVGAVIGLAQGNLQPAIHGAAVGAAVGGAKHGFDSARDAVKGQPVSCFEAFEKVVEEEPVVFQRATGRSLSLPVLGKVCWFQDRGRGSEIEGKEELRTYYLMHHGEAEEEKKSEPKPQVSIVENNLHVHQYIS